MRRQEALQGLARKKGGKSPDVCSSRLAWVRRDDSRDGDLRQGLRRGERRGELLHGRGLVGGGEVALVQAGLRSARLWEDVGIMVGGTILVVDDDEPMRKALTTRLGVEGYVAMSASNGCEALDRLREAQPRVILLDYAMPVMDGRAFRNAQKMDARWSAIPVVLITAHHLTAFQARSIDALAILQKPLSFETLAPVLERVCGREARTDETPRIVLTSRRRRA